MSTKYKITHIQLFKYAEPRQINDEGDFEIVYSYSANITINDDFIIQLSGSEQSACFDGICSSEEAFWKSREAQDEAFLHLIDSDIEDELEQQGFENNVGWLEDHADDVVDYRSGCN